MKEWFRSPEECLQEDEVRFLKKPDWCETILVLGARTLEARFKECYPCNGFYVDHHWRANIWMSSKN